MSGRKKREVERGRWMEKVVAGFARQEKGGLTMSKKIIGGLIAVLVVVVLGSRVAFAASHTADVTLTITPGDVGITLTATPNTVAFGTVDLSKSSAPAQGVLISNSGSVGATIAKQVQSISATFPWSLAESTGTQDNMVLWSFSQETAPSISDFGTVGSYGVATSSFVVSIGSDNPLKDSGGAQITIEPGRGATTWYRIDVPNTVGGSGEQSIVVRFTGTTN